MITWFLLILAGLFLLIVSIRSIQKSNKIKKLESDLKRTRSNHDKFVDETEETIEKLRQSLQSEKYNTREAREQRDSSREELKTKISDYNDLDLKTTKNIQIKNSKIKDLETQLSKANADKDNKDQEISKLKEEQKRIVSDKNKVVLENWKIRR